MRREGDVNRILRKVKKIEEDQEQEMNDDDGQTLDAQFLALVQQRDIYISETVEDPIEQSY